jgi:hypothetical protein
VLDADVQRLCPWPALEERSISSSVHQHIAVANSASSCVHERRGRGSKGGVRTRK